MARILVVEDDRSIAGLIELYLRRDQHEVDAFENGAVALKAWETALTGSRAFELAVLDLMLPGLDGRGLARRMRAVSTVPILMLTALDDIRDKVEGFELGADDYLTKPFDPNELVLRVRAILRRTVAPAATHTFLHLANAEIDLDARRLSVAGREVTLRTKEFDLLALLAEHVDMVLTRQQLLDRIWAGEFDSDSRTVDVHVSRLRERLSASHAEMKIDTIRSVGYRLSVPA